MSDKTDIKTSEETLAEIYRNCQLAIESITDILPEIADDDIKTEILRQHEEYEKISAKAAVIAKNKGMEIKEPNPMKKAMMWGAIKMNTMTDNSKEHIAALMIRGTVTGITSLKTTLGDMPEHADEEIKALIKELIDLEEQFEERLKSFL